MSPSPARPSLEQVSFLDQSYANMEEILHSEDTTDPSGNTSMSFDDVFITAVISPQPQDKNKAKPRNSTQRFEAVRHELGMSLSQVRRQSLLGRGGFATVFRAMKSQKQVALKTVDHHRLRDSQVELAELDMEYEAKLLSQLNHPHIIQLHGLNKVGCNNNRFLVLDVLEKETLWHKIEHWRQQEDSYLPLLSAAPTSSSKPPPPKKGWKGLFQPVKRIRNLSNGLRKKKQDVHFSNRTLAMGPIHARVETVAIGIASALKYLHSQHILYRDFKPANIGFDCHSQTVQLFDFGLARKISDCHPGDISGTPRYVSPEVWKGRGHVPASDVYGFTMVLFELVSLTKPWNMCRDVKDIMHCVVTLKDRPRKWKDIPSMELQDLIAQGWHHNPSIRPTFDEYHSRLVEWVAKGPAPGEKDTTLPSDPNEPTGSTTPPSDEDTLPSDPSGPTSSTTAMEVQC